MPASFQLCPGELELRQCLDLLLPAPLAAPHSAAQKHPASPDCQAAASTPKHGTLLTGRRCSWEWKNGWPYAPARHSTWRRGCRALARLWLFHHPGILYFHWGPSLCRLPSLQGKNPVCLCVGVNFASSLKANIQTYATKAFPVRHLKKQTTTTFFYV